MLLLYINPVPLQIVRRPKKLKKGTSNVLQRATFRCFGHRFLSRFRSLLCRHFARPERPLQGNVDHLGHDGCSNLRYDDCSAFTQWPNGRLRNWSIRSANPSTDKGFQGVDQNREVLSGRISCESGHLASLWQCSGSNAQHLVGRCDWGHSQLHSCLVSSSRGRQAWLDSVVQFLCTGGYLHQTLGFCPCQPTADLPTDRWHHGLHPPDEASAKLSLAKQKPLLPRNWNRGF